MKPICYNAKGEEIPLTSGQVRRNARAAAHQSKRKSGWQGDRISCDSCGGEQSWCSCCETYTKTCCVDWGTCMCS